MPIPSPDQGERLNERWHQLANNPLQAATWHALANLYSTAAMPWQAAFAAQQALRLDSSLESRLPAQPGTHDPQRTLPHKPERRDAAIRTLQTWLQNASHDWLSWLLLARWRDHPEPIAQACATEPINGETLHWLGLWRLQAGDPQGAVVAFKGLVDLVPQRHGSMLYLGEALLQLGQRAAAEKAFTRASGSSNPAFLRFLAQRVYAQNYWQEAIAVLRRALDLSPDTIETLLALARLHWEVYELSEADALLQRILKLDPTNSEVPYLLNALPGRRGDAAAHLAAVEAHHACLGNPSSRLASSIAMASLYVDALSPKQVAERHRQLCQPIEQAFTTIPSFANTRHLDRPLRIGLVSADFHRQHPVNLFMLPLLERLNGQEFPVTLFHTGSMHDEDTQRARNACEHWIEAGTFDDHTLQQSILNERIDILLDLAGHTSSHRLGVFAMGAAPVQATFLGYPHSTGLTRMQWLIGDPIVAPAEHSHLFSEGIAQLPNSVFCWCPLDQYPLPPPRPQDAALVFGSFNNVMKLSPRTIGLWAAVLRDLPDSRLLLKAPSLRDNSVIDRFHSLFATHGITADRLSFEGPSELGQMMQRYGEVDIALDPTPYNGGTTTLQALWMGVPVITLCGGNFVSRMGTSFLTALGHTEWIAHDDTSYRAIAHELAHQLPAIREGRAALRRQMASSGLSDLERYTDHFQQLLRRMWKHHCSGNRERLLAAVHTNNP
jgi:protein O-GlcNAc transferase